MNIILRHTLALLLSSLIILPAYAVEFDAQVEKVKWVYQEYAKDRFVTNVLPTSKTQGDAGLFKLRLSSERDGQWFSALTASLMDSTSWANEKWGSVQTNDLKIKQQDVRFDLQYRMLDARFGVWVSHRKQTQTRQNYAGSAAAAAGLIGKASEEVIMSDWAGVSFTGRGGREKQLEIRIDAAVALRVGVDNSLLAVSYTKKDGYRTGIHFRWTLPKPEVGVEGLNLTLRYEYQELGGEVTVANEFWPYNRWQMASLGLLYAW